MVVLWSFSDGSSNGVLDSLKFLKIGFVDAIIKRITIVKTASDKSICKRKEGGPR